VLWICPSTFKNFVVYNDGKVSDFICVTIDRMSTIETRSKHDIYCISFLSMQSTSGIAVSVKSSCHLQIAS
jgi:hypothetical protein